MKTTPIVAAEVDFSDPAAARSPAYDDIYHPRHGAFAQARRVFLAGNGLPRRWQGRARFSVLETGFGLGNNFLATWAAWRDDPQRCQRLYVVSIEKHPLRPADLARAHAASPAPELARQLVDAWPPATCNLHRCEFDGGRVQLLLAFGDIAAWAREIVASIDAFYLDGFAPARNPAMWDRGVFAMLARLAAPGATAATWSAASSVRDGLRGAGFVVESAPGDGAKRDITLARFAPRFVAPPPPGRVLPGAAPAQAIVVGAGLAGALTARALAREGIACTLIDRHAEPAAEASGNPAGLFHGAVMGHDGPHARWLRASALAAEPLLREALAGGCAGRIDGLLRLESKLPWAAMRALVEDQALPASHVEAVDAEAATRIAGLRVTQPAWFYPAGGWIDPAGLVRHAIATAGVRWHGGRAVERIARAGPDWQAIDDAGRVIAAAPLIVLANAGDALRLAGLPAHWLQRRRGQISWSVQPVVHGPRVPIASGGYVLRLADGRLLFGASNDDDRDPALREADHRGNRARLAALVGRALLAGDAALDGRVGWRATSADRLPLAGPAPDLDAAPAPRADAVRLLPRRTGLWLHTGLGSRGLTTAVLAAELIAAQASGAPWPLEADLVDALDPSRLLLGTRRLARAFPAPRATAPSLVTTEDKEKKEQTRGRT